ncbi:hypothetical protein [Vibrio taketomensis]|uniref:hypothetical protein n=1 Tax=Vibrio taketomensis TaxID=2572923 RepID=UPI00138A1472|nr:hypothetical protein [Vibrio taketomensis]
MTGNFTGMIDIAGGLTANIAKTPHVAKQSSWVVRIPLDDATDGMEAWRIAVDTIQENTLKLLATKGLLRVRLSLMSSDSLRLEQLFGRILFIE